MRAKAAIKSEIIIIQALAVRKEIGQHEMPKETGLSYRTILRNLRPLEKRNEIKLIRTIPSEKGGKEKKIYVITFKGLVHALSNCFSRDRRFRASLEDIIKAHPDKLLTFKKWTLFEKADLKDFMLENLEKALRSETVETAIFSAVGLNRIFKNDKEWQDTVDRAILTIPILSGTYRQHGINYIKVCKQDKELKDFITQRLALIETRIRKELDMIKHWNGYVVRYVVQ
jgi:DNA-binding PadR family transcriptional regulator